MMHAFNVGAQPKKKPSTIYKRTASKEATVIISN